MSILLIVAGAVALALLLALSPATALRLAVASVVALACAASPALAETSTLVGLAGSVFGWLVVPVGSAVGGVLVLLVGNALWKAVNRGLDLLEERTGIEVDAAHRQALHSALDTGLHLAIQRGAPIVQDAVAAWVKASVPDAVAHFGLSTELLDGLVDAKIAKAAQATIAAPLALPGAILSDLGAAGAAVGLPAIASGGIPPQLAGAAS